MMIAHWFKSIHYRFKNELKYELNTDTGSVDLARDFYFYR